MDLLRVLIARGVALDAISSHGESGLRVLSNNGRFDAVGLLLDAGADEAQLAWTPLIRAVALGTAAAVERELAAGAELEARDWWERTAWLVAIQTGDVAKTQLLRDRGADFAARGRCGKPPLFYAIGNRHEAMLKWLLHIGLEPGQYDDFGTTALEEAVDRDNPQAVEILLAAGADVNAERNGRGALDSARSAETAQRLLDAGANPADLPFGARRAMLGLEPEPDEDLLDVSAHEFSSGRARRFGTRNPDDMSSAYTVGMIRAGLSGYQAQERFAGQVPHAEGPVWCAQRFGQSITFLPDGRIVQVGGEHEDWYDPDFCIYNDVFEHRPGGKIRVFGYPEAVFPPTDFHTATLLGRYVYLIGCLGYRGQRHFGTTPVCRLDTETFRIEPLATGGQPPGWLYNHRAERTGDHLIRVWGGTVATQLDGDEVHAENANVYLLDVQARSWSVVVAGD